MRFLRRLLDQWSEDHLLRKVVRNSSYLFSSNSISMVLTFLQGLLAAALLGVANYGTLGLIISFASNVNRLLSFRMNELVIKYGGQYLAEGKKDQAAVTIKAAALSEALTSMVAYTLLVLLAQMAATYIVKDERAVPWIIFYGLALLANAMTETAQAVLQLGGHFRTQALMSLAQNIITAAWILGAYLLQGNIFDVIMAYLVGKLVFGVGMLIAALYWMPPLLGAGWLGTPFSRLPEWKPMLRFAISTNLSQTVNMVIRDSELLWVGFLLNNVYAGYYKFAIAIMNVIILPITPFIQTTFPEITRAVTMRAWNGLRSLLRRTSLIAVAWTVLTGLGILIVGPIFLQYFKGGEYLPAYPVIWVLFAGYSFANIFYWNRPLLLALGRPNFPLVVTLIVGLVKMVLMFLLVQEFGVIMQAALLSGYFILSISIIVLNGLGEVRKKQLAN